MQRMILCHCSPEPQLRLSSRQGQALPGRLNQAPQSLLQPQFFTLPGCRVAEGFLCPSHAGISNNRAQCFTSHQTEIIQCCPFPMQKCPLGQHKQESSWRLLGEVQACPCVCGSHLCPLKLFCRSIRDGGEVRSCADVSPLS